MPCTGLPQINTGRCSAPLGFGNTAYPEFQSRPVSPGQVVRTARTPAFHQQQQIGNRLQWDDYP